MAQTVATHAARISRLRASWAPIVTEAARIMAKSDKKIRFIIECIKCLEIIFG